MFKHDTKINKKNSNITMFSTQFDGTWSWYYSKLQEKKRDDTTCLCVYWTGQQVL